MADARIYSYEDELARRLPPVHFASLTVDRDGDSIVILRDGKPVLELTVAGARGLWAVLGNAVGDG